MKLLPVPSVLASLALLAPAQIAAQPAVFDGPILQYHSGDYEPPAGVGNGPYRKIVDLDFDGDLMLDAVLLDGDVPVVVHAPSVFNAMQDLLGSTFAVRDMERLPRSGPNGEDGLVVLTSQGLQYVIQDSSGFVLIGITSSPDWLSATQLHVIDLGGIVMVLGLTQDGETVVSRLRDQGQWARGPSFLAGEPVLEMTSADWDADGTVEVVLATATSLLPFELRGTARAPLVAEGRTLGIAALRGQEGEGDQIAWITQGAVDKWLSIADSTGILETYLLALPIDDSGLLVDFDFVGVAAGDVDRDGDPDLVIGQKSSLVVPVLLNVGGETPEFEPSVPAGRVLLYLTEEGTFLPVPGNDCPPSVADYDGDGFADLLSARDDALLLNLQQGVINGNAESSGAILGGLTVDDFLYDVSDFEWSSQPAKLHLVMTLPVEYFTFFSHVELSVWRQDSPTAPMPDEVDWHALFAMDKTAGVSTDQWLTIDDTASQLFPGGPTWPGQQQFFVVFRCVNLVAGSTLVETASPTFAFGTTLQPWPGAPQPQYTSYLRALPGAYSALEDVVDLREGDGPPEPNTGPGGRTVVGAIVFQRVLPPMTEAPKPWPPGPPVRFMREWLRSQYW